MKSRIIYLGVILAFAVTSCSGFLDQAPENNRLTVPKTFAKKANVKNFLANIYSKIPDYDNERYTPSSATGSGPGPWLGSSSEAEYRWPFVKSNSVNKGEYNASTGWIDILWQRYYKGIRAATFFMSHINECSVCGSKLRVQYRAEARTLRAYYYYLLMRMFGPVPLVKKVIPHDANLSEVKLSRTPFDSLANYVASQLDSAIVNLPFKPQSSIDIGRVDQGFAAGLKVKLLTMAARPLYNGNSFYAGMKNPDGTQLINQNFEKKKWKRAANAAKEFINKYVPNPYHLYKEYDSDGTYDPFLSVRDVILEPWNSGDIFMRNQASVETRTYEEVPEDAGAPSGLQGSGGLGATQWIVNQFFMANGRTIWDPKSGYQKSGTSMFQAPDDNTQRTTFNEWVNRGPRFYAYITYTNRLWLYTGAGDFVPELDYTGNSGKKVGGNDYSPTGYIVRKNMGIESRPSSRSTATILRLAQIYLDYAEALNESDPGNPDILEYLNKIRERAGLPGYGSSSLPAPASPDSMRAAIRQERNVELCFESGDRYFYAREWKIANKTDNGPQMGLTITADVPEFYKKEPFETRVTKEKQYLLPIPQHEITVDENLVQNTGWK
jgi:hypothetical protein